MHFMAMVWHLINVLNKTVMHDIIKIHYTVKEAHMAANCGRRYKQHLARNGNAQNAEGWFPVQSTPGLIACLVDVSERGALPMCVCVCVCLSVCRNISYR